MYKKVPIFRCTTPSTGKRLEEFEVVVGTLYRDYQMILAITTKGPVVFYYTVFHDPVGRSSDRTLSYDRPTGS